MPSQAELLASIRRWLVAGVLALGVIAFQLSSIQQGVALHQGGLPDLMRLVGFLIAVAALVALVNDDWERYR
ncbi:hypothetical protein DM867_05115 [Halosegnis rubeus]|jgi:protein-S-isoprenylcysteine O-methyltransferase Ste14|uniref:Uncharacterized protein n=1 Tax=Halosegnis rubeus TaxID=2212850 RepID=A0A5N5UCR5_9EURY|nr:hypothetical protein [Halosegnis rubeus]KAB7513487.1 hypothetical protein DP108_12930 [Halosegnis rubeus]KAB7515442.1 hypothetical protein DMP03_09500 [Halosegnis rubeus]KAB7516494.1 hypothetical protein DM867_05115 [Halosegnis rubeus]